MRRIADHDAVPRASESELLAVRVLADTYKRVTVGDRDWLPTLRIDCQQVPHGGHARGLHRRRGLKGRLHMARTVRVRARRVLGAAAIVGGATVLCLVAAIGLTHSGNSSVAGYQKPANPFFHPATGRHESRTDTAGNSQSQRSSSVGGLPAPSTPSIPNQPSIPDLPIPNQPSIPDLPIPSLPSDLPIPSLPISLDRTG
jgi:hypothetical protein